MIGGEKRQTGEDIRLVCVRFVARAVGLQHTPMFQKSKKVAGYEYFKWMRRHHYKPWMGVVGWREDSGPVATMVGSLVLQPPGSANMSRPVKRRG